MSDFPVVNENTGRRLESAARACYWAGLDRVRSADDVQHRFEVRDFGSIRAVRCSTMPQMDWYNRALPGELIEREAFEDLIAFFQEANCPCRMEFGPADFQPEWGELLVTHGFLFTSFYSVLCGIPTSETETLPDDVTIRELPGEESEEYARLWCDAFEIDEDKYDNAVSIRKYWYAAAGYRRFMGYIDGQPAGTLGLFIHEQTGVMEDAATLPNLRGRGVQSALIRHLRNVAADAGCTLLAGATAFGNTSQNNAERNGFRVAYTKGVWRRPSTAE